jgi:hypothetical protein
MEAGIANQVREEIVMFAGAGKRHSGRLNYSLTQRLSSCRNEIILDNYNESILHHAIQ